MGLVARATFNTPSMPKTNVRPLASMNSNTPQTSPSSREITTISMARTSRLYEAGRFILQVVGRVKSAVDAMKSVFQPKPVFSASYLTFLVKVLA